MISYHFVRRYHLDVFELAFAWSRFSSLSPPPLSHVTMVTRVHRFVQEIWRGGLLTKMRSINVYFLIHIGSSEVMKRFFWKINIPWIQISACQCWCARINMSIWRLKWTTPGSSAIVSLSHDWAYFVCATRCAAFSSCWRHVFAYSWIIALIFEGFEKMARLYELLSTTRL